jgi:hypothetical protein
MQAKLQEIVNRLMEAHGENLISVILYGSAVAASGNRPPSDFQLLVVTEYLSAVDIRRASVAMKWWEMSGFPRATCFTKKEFLNSLDVFPIEFRQMQRSYRVLAGEDLLANVVISKLNLRLLTEYELRGKLLRLRALYLATSDDPEQVTRLVTDSVVSFVQYLRPVLELLGDVAPLGRLATVRRVGEQLRIETAPLERALRLRDEPVDLLDMEVQDLFASYLTCLEQVIEAVDRI